MKILRFFEKFDIFSNILEFLENSEIFRKYFSDGIFSHLKIVLIKKWNAVRPVSRSLDWDRDIVSDQIQERENLKLHSDKNHGAKNCASLIQECVTSITQSADQALTLADRAQPDISLAKAASGALADAAFDAILSTLAMDDRQTPAKSKFELFQIGRWPLSMTKEVFFIF